MSNTNRLSILTGTEEERKAIETVKTAKASGAERLGRRKRKQFEDAQHLVRRFRTRQALALGIPSLAALSVMVVLSGSKSETVVQTHASSRTSTSRLNNPQGSSQYGTVEDHDRNIDRFVEGPFTFTFDSGFASDEKERLQAVIHMSMQGIMQYVPVPDDVGRPITIKRSGASEANRSYASYQESEIIVNPSSSDGLIAHELVHLLHGSRDTYLGFLEEGTATAVSILVLEDTQLESWDRTIHNEVSDSMKNGGLALMPNVPYHYYQPLYTTRLQFAAELWIDLERQFPGAIHRIHEAYYDFLDSGGTKEELMSGKILEIVYGKYPEARQIWENNPVMRFPRNAPERSVKLYMQYEHYSNDGKRVIAFFVVDKHGPTGAERGRGKNQIVFNIENLTTGQVSSDHLIVTRPNGEATFLTFLPGEVEDQLYELAGIGKRYRVSAEVNGVREGFTFSYE